MKNRICNALCWLGLLVAFAALPVSTHAKSPQFQFTFEEALALTFEMQLSDNEILELFLDGLIDEESAMLLLEFNAFEPDAKMSGTDLGSGRIKGVSGLDLGSGR